MKATVLVDNIGNREIKGEWGLCIHIEYLGKQILLDSGASELFAQNAKSLNISLEEIDYAVLSHAHCDHANGMRVFFERNTKAQFYLRDTCTENCYFKKWIIRKHVGLQRGILEEYKERIELVHGNYQIMEGAMLLPHTTPRIGSLRKKRMYVKEGHSFRPDSFAHEQRLVFDTSKGLVVFNSCSHGGADNIIKEVSNVFQDKKVYALIGGFHLAGTPKKIIRELAKRIKENGTEYVCTGHCTGKRAYGILKEELGDTLHQLRTGLIMEC